MATDRPPPYFPQGALSPPSATRYRKFKFALFGLAVLILLLISGVGLGIWYLAKHLL